MREARSIIASDVLISTNRPWTQRSAAAARTTAGDRRRCSIASEAIETATMVRAGRGRRRGADGGAARRAAGIPVLRPRGPAGRADLTRTICCADRGALVRPELLTQLGIKVGGRLIIGGQPFTIRGVIAQEPGRRVGAFSFGSRVLIDYDDLRATGLLAFGSRASYQILLRVREQAVEPTDPRHPPRLPRPLRPGALLPLDRGRHRRGPACAPRTI